LLKTGWVTKRGTALYLVSQGNLSYMLRNAQRFAKLSWVALLPFIAFVYVGLVLENVWNWFLAPAIHGSEIGFGQAIGMLCFTRILNFVCTRDFEKERRWAGTRIVIAACVPEDKLSRVVAALKAQQQTGWRDTESGAQIISITGIAVLAGIIHGLS